MAPASFSAAASRTAALSVFSHLKRPRCQVPGVRCQKGSSRACEKTSASCAQKGRYQKVKITILQIIFRCKNSHSQNEVPPLRARTTPLRPSIERPLFLFAPSLRSQLTTDN